MELKSIVESSLLKGIHEDWKVILRIQIICTFVSKKQNPQ